MALVTWQSSVTRLPATASSHRARQTALAGNVGMTAVEDHVVIATEAWTAATLALACACRIVRAGSAATTGAEEAVGPAAGSWSAIRAPVNARATAFPTVRVANAATTGAGELVARVRVTTAASQASVRRFACPTALASSVATTGAAVAAVAAEVRRSANRTNASSLLSVGQLMSIRCWWVAAALPVTVEPSQRRA